MSSITIPVYRPQITSLEKQFVNECLDSGWISSKGSFVERFETEFSAYVGTSYAVSMSNGTTALHAAILALGIGEGDEVIVPSLTYVAAANAVTYTGARVVFVDCCRRSWQIDPDDVRKAITPKTRGIVAVHLYGHPCDMDALRNIADEFDLLLIEDCAEAIGSYYRQQHVGTFGDVAAFSFYGNKTITTGEGGMVVTSNPSIAERAAHIKGQGLAKFREYWHDIIGYNYRMTNICAAIGCAQMTRIDKILARKQEIAQMYRTVLSEQLEFQDTLEHCTHSNWMVCCLSPNAGMRNRMREFLTKRGIETRPVFYPIHSMPMYARHYRRMPVAELISSRGINLPSFPDLTDEELSVVCSSVLQSLAEV
jgi:perosamine synthetase